MTKAHRHGLLIANVVALSATMQAAHADESVMAGPHFRITCDFQNDTVAEQALETAESIWPQAVRLFGGKDTPLDTLFEIHLYHSARSFAKADADLTGARNRSNMAFSHRKTRSAHVALQPPCSDETLAEIGIPALTRYQIAHEATHLAAYQMHPQSKPDQSWLREGCATWVAEQVMAEHGWIAGAEEDPYAATNMVRAKRLLEKGRLPHVRDILTGNYLTLGFYHRYAVDWLFFKFLMQNRYREEITKAMKFTGTVDSGAARARKALERHSIEKIDRDFRRFVRSLSPAWYETRRSLETQGPTWTQIAFEGKDAVAWRTTEVAPDNFRVSGSIEILPNRGDSMRVLLGRTDHGHIEVDFSSDGEICVQRFSADTDQRRRLALAQGGALLLGRAAAFEIAAEDGWIQVFLDGEQIVRAKVEDGELHGAWGLGAAAGSAGNWTRVRLHMSQSDE